jgi:hypothetical protein
VHADAQNPAEGPSEAARPVMTLDYGRPASPSPLGRGRRDAIWGGVISFCLAMGSGWITFGFLMMMGQRDDHAGPIAVGVGFIVLGLGLAGTLLLLRRQPPFPPR